MDTLFALCDGLAASLAEGEALRARWVAAVLADYLAARLVSIRPDEASAARVLRELVRNQRM